MKKITCLMMLLVSITVNLCAQTNNSDKFFQVPDNIIITRRFFINLENGNKMQIDLTDITDLNVISNIDSLLQVFSTDIAGLKDSVADPLSSKRIDYFTDAKGRKKIRFQQHQPKGASFLLDKGDLASLRTEQDTINIIGIIPNAPKPEQKISISNPRYYHLTFWLNNINELPNYLHGELQQKVTTIQQHLHDKWPIQLGGSHHYLISDKDISAERAKGFTQNAIGDYVNGYIAVNLQNYKNYFVPSFSVGAKFTFTNRNQTFKWEPGIYWEPHFLFNRDSTGKTQTFRNDFLTVSYAQGGTTDYNSQKDFSFSAAFSLGYLIHRQGDIIDKNTFRLGVGKIKYSKISVEPSMYFNNFFKGITPCVRISFGF
jgi:hypothetical protein